MMERALKERIIGAVVLVIFAVLVVPIFLDGPPADGEIVTERVLLPGQEDQKTQTVVLYRLPARLCRPNLSRLSLSRSARSRSRL